MSDEKRRKSANNNEPKGNNGLWLVLAGVVSAVMLSAFLFGNKEQRLRYPDLLALLGKEAIYFAQSQSAVAVEYSDKSQESNSETVASDDPQAVSAQNDTVSKETSQNDKLPETSQSSENVSTNQAVALDHNRSIIVPSIADPSKRVEYSRPQNIKVAEDMITGTVLYRAVDASGHPTSKDIRRVDFETIRTIRNEAEDKRLAELLSASGVVWDNDRPSRFFEENWPQILMIGVLVLLGIMMLRRIGGVGSPMSFSRSRGKLYGQEELPITFEDVAGIEEAVEEVREVVDFLKNSEKYQALGGRIPKGVLLVGPPGTGKTLLAKAIAGEAGVPFFSLSGSDFVEMFVGVGAARVRDMFQQATNRAPCIIFIDELDALGKSRSGSVVGGHDEREQTLNALLVEMDGFDSNSGVIVVAATNRPETLDPALLRPGRFDRHVLVDRPDVGGREEILKVHVKNVRLDDDVELRDIASITPGFVGADLANLVNEAALLAAREGKQTVTIDQFNEAVERVTAGLEKKKRVMNEDEKIRVAYHEAGHAIVAAALPNTDPVHKVSIIPRGLAALGYTMQRPESERYLMTKSELESNMKVLLAGTLTEEMIFQDISTGAQNDLERCTEIARSMVMDYGMSRMGRINFRRSSRSAFLAGGGNDGYQMMHSEEMAKMIDKEVARIVEDSLMQTRDILAQRREVLEAVTQRLLEVESIDSDELVRLIQVNSKGPWLVPGTVTEKPLAQIRPSEDGTDGETESTKKSS